MPATIATALILLVLMAGPAAARSVSGVDANNFRTSLKSVRPDLPGIHVRVVEIGSRLELTNETNREVIVLGYQDEPYLRVGTNGVYENRRSPAVYINASRQSDVIIPGSASPEAQPEWQKVSSGSVARWHDHRTHWMGNEDPPAVRRDPGHTHVVIPKWTVTILIGGEEVLISGDLVWVPGSSAIPWLILAAVAFAVVAIVVLTSGGTRRLAAVVATLLVLDVIHTIGYASAKAGGLGTKFEQVASGSFYSVAAWAMALAAVVLLMRERRAGLFVAMIAGLVLAVLGGAIDFTDLTRSQVPFGWSPWIARLLVSISLGGGLGLAVAADIRARREAPPRLRPST